MEYTVAFLNDGGGRILFGISNDQIVKGVKLNREERDNIRLLINNKISDCVQPAVSPNAYSLEFHQVFNKSNEVITDLYIIEVLIKPPVDPTIVYFDNKDKVWSKVNGGKRPLKGPAIQDFILRKSLIKTLTKSENKRK
ncbi:ATP-binding protein [Bacillus sp. P2(2020)]|uniref:ATP-binding protein n=1 Tax=Calidifontibacillus erzurumensis TaxID=2741433 RepID=A0A8J8K9N0_9BACI|nr:ATP-binding protein [Calidifontibacillus erzurumensis]